jgi:RimJ/RimL family protein N-acetyltransferase
VSGPRPDRRPPAAEFFRTPRLVFRPFAPQDLDDLARVAGDPEVVRHTDDGRPLDRDICALWIARSRANVAKFGYGTGALTDRGSGRFVGWAGFARPEGGPEEIIYGFETPAWGRGLGSEIVGGLVRYAFETLNLPEIRATVHDANVASRRILLKAGFERRPWPETAACLYVLANPAAG